MPTISVRGTEMPASPIRKLAPLADAAAVAFDIAVGKQYIFS